ncbi:hypothetical protein L840_1646 [Mycobacterium sp. MAC_011194_8550]|nr:hypothetical protein L840_1646 [Mycobacterium sp. MAC_011194_8550]
MADTYQLGIAAAFQRALAAPEVVLLEETDEVSIAVVGSG